MQAIYLSRVRPVQHHRHGPGWFVVETGRLPAHIQPMEKTSQEKPQPETETPAGAAPEKPGNSAGGEPVERGGPKGPEPTRYGDWEKNGRCTDF